MKRQPRVLVRPSDLLGCIRVDLTRITSQDGIRKRVWHDLAACPPGVTIQIVVGEKTPTMGLALPDGHKVQLVAPDGETYRRWAWAFAEEAQK